MSYNQIILDNNKWINDIWKKIEEKLSRTAVKNRDKLPYTTCDGEYDDLKDGKGVIAWTNGFWGGLMWLMYSETKKDIYKMSQNVDFSKQISYYYKEMRGESFDFRSGIRGF